MCNIEESVEPSLLSPFMGNALKMWCWGFPSFCATISHAHLGPLKSEPRAFHSHLCDLEKDILIFLVTPLALLIATFANIPCFANFLV